MKERFHLRLKKIQIISGGDPVEAQFFRQKYFEDPLFRTWLEDPFGFSLTRPSPDFCLGPSKDEPSRDRDDDER